MAKEIDYTKLSTKKLLAEAEKRGIEVTAEMTEDQIVAKLQEMDAANSGGSANNQGSDDNKPSNQPTAKKNKGGSIFYWLKSNVYKDESNILPPGLYEMDEAVARFDRLGSDTVEKFEGEIPYKHLVRISQKLGIKAEDHEEDELLDILLKK